MSEALRILSVGAGTLLAIVVFAVIVFWFIEDVTQKKHAVLRFQANGATSALNMLYPYPTLKAAPVRPTAGVAPAQAGAQSRESAHAAD